MTAWMRLGFPCKILACWIPNGFGPTLITLAPLMYPLPPLTS